MNNKINECQRCGEETINTLNKKTINPTLMCDKCEIEAPYIPPN